MSETRSGVLPDHDIYLLDDELTEEQREVRDRVRAFVDAELMPVINDYWERAEFPFELCLLYTSPSPRDRTRSRMPSSA